MPDARDGARVSETDPYAATAIALVDNGIPAVVAMQFEISDKAAIAFSNATYLALTSSQPVDAAVTLARQAILTTSRNEWATPVLYLRTSDGTLFAWDRDTVVEAARADALSAPLEQPVGLQASSGAHGVMLSWTAVAGAAGVRYEVYRNGRLVGETEEPRFTDPAGEPETDAAYSVVAVDESGRRSPSSAEVSPPPVSPSETPVRRRSWLGPVLAAVLALVIVGVVAWVAAGRPWPPGPTPPTPTTSTTRSTTTSVTPTTGTGTTSVPPPTGGLAVTLPRVTLVGAANQISVVTQVRNLGTQASTAGRSLLVTVTGPVKIVGPTEGCATVPNGLRCSVPVLLSGASSQRVLAVSPPPDGQPVTVTAVLTPGDGGGNDTATRTITCVKGVCDGTGPSPT